MKITDFRIVLIILISILYCLQVRAQHHSVIAPAQNGWEDVAKFSVSDNSDNYLRIRNATSVNGTFLPSLQSFNGRDNRTTFFIGGEAGNSYDNGSAPVVIFSARKTGGAIQNRPLFAWSNYTSTYMTMLANGNLGVGTQSPATKLHVMAGVNTYPQLRLHEAGGTKSVDLGHDGTNAILRTNEGNLLLVGGNVGVGTTTTSSHRLAVEGTIGSREVIVETDAWPDYVFEDAYKLPTLKEVEDFISEYHHLPEIPSAEVIQNEGISLGEMNARLLEKIEELTLYTIQQEKKIRIQGEQYKVLLQRVERLQTIVDGKNAFE